MSNQSDRLTLSVLLAVICPLVSSCMNNLKNLSKLGFKETTV
jgi:hypothetical protein